MKETKQNSDKPEEDQTLSLAATEKIAFELHNEILLFQKFHESAIDQSLQEFESKVLPKIKDAALKAGQNSITSKVKDLLFFLLFFIKKDLLFWIFRNKNRTVVLKL